MMGGNAYSLCRSTTFVQHDLFNGALNFRQVERLALQRNGIAQDRLDLDEFVGIASDEIELFERHAAFLVAGICVEIL